MPTIDFVSMGCRGRAIVESTDHAACDALVRLPEWLRRVERTLSRFDPDGALAALNRLGHAAPADDLLWSAVDVAVDAARTTNGLVTPTVLDALERAGYDRTFDDVPGDLEARVGAPTPAPDWRTISRDPVARSIRLAPGVRLDLGGTAKGWIADLAAARLAPLGPVLVDLGGDLALVGDRREPWPIAVADPRAEGRELALLVVPRGGVATSGRDVRRWRRGGVAQHHLIDPRTGAPARTDVLTATVMAPTALDAEIAAKRVVLEGSVAGLEWLERRHDLAALVVLDDGTVVESARLSPHLWKESA
jgi:thiamine biosynthesis lipoprotein